MTLVLKGKSIGSDQKTVLKGELLIWRTNNEARDQGIMVQLKDSIWFKSQSKLVPRKLDPGPSSKVGLRYASVGNFMDHFVLCKKGRNELAINCKAIYTAMLQLVEILTKLACLEL
jgi:hypothetical protein